jgi:hypothetical protein
MNKTHMHWKMLSLKETPDRGGLEEYEDEIQSLIERRKWYVEYLNNFEYNINLIDKDDPEEAALIEDWGYGDYCKAKIEAIDRMLKQQRVEKNGGYDNDDNNTQSNPIDLQNHDQPNPRAKSLNFADYLICEANIKPAIMDILHAYFTTARTGKPAATMLLALDQLKFITLGARNKQSLYNAINQTFGLKLKNQSCQRYIKYGEEGIYSEIPETEIQQIRDRLSNNR